MSLVSAFQKIFEKYPDKIAIEFKNKSISFKKLNQISTNLSSNLNTKKGDCIALFLSNSLELIYSFVAILKSGSIVVPINTHFKEQETKDILDNTNPKLIITDNHHLEILNKINTKNKILTIESDEFKSHLIKEVKKDKIKIQDNDPAIIFHTSGTTGKSKGALLTHKNLESNLKDLKQIWKFTEKDILLLSLPLFHIHGLGVALCSCLYNGYKIKLKEKFKAEETLNLLQNCTLFMGVPTMYIKMLETTNTYNLNSMRLFISGSAPLSKETFYEFKQKFNHEILERAGMSESNMNFSNLIEKKVPGSVGKPIGNLKIKIVDKNFKELKPNQIGSILIKGPNVFNEYYNDKEATKKSFKDGFFITGDIGYVNEEGYVFFIGRSKDVIISGGINIYPQEVEQVLNSHPNIKESAVVDVWDKYFGETIKAFVVGKNLNEEEIIKYCKGKLASFKKPKYVEIINSLPKNSMGKILKKELR